MEWRFYGPILLAVVMFLLVGTIFEKRIEQALRSFIDRRRAQFLRQEAAQTSLQQSNSNINIQATPARETAEPTQQTTTKATPTEQVTSTAKDIRLPCADTNPQSTAEVKVTYNANLKASNIQELKPSNIQELKPSNIQDLKPSKKQDLKPSNKQEFKPSNIQDLKPSNKQEFKPSNIQDLTPSNKQEFKPSNIQELKNSKTPEPKPPLVQHFKSSDELNLKTPTIQDLKNINLQDIKIPISILELKNPNTINVLAVDPRKVQVLDPKTPNTLDVKTPHVSEVRISNFPDSKTTTITKIESETNPTAKPKPPEVIIPTRSSSLPTVSKIHLATLTNELNAKSTSKRSLLTCKSAAILNIRNVEQSSNQKEEEKDVSRDEKNLRSVKKG